ncbi:class I SAM-dependent methyltransferase [uncultured Sulfitobacter sp.]|uniref:class I SAM-dependent methyltransferase n=1 Tax=uncultured Sulfitobacter sp. TaxID=191468 RepID=UPI0026160E80|nr:class I SAM-dependent methyltransferase [uncultured Sulfitobacter sp.]
MSDPETLRVYAAKHADYATRTDDHNKTDPLLAAFIANLDSGGRALDLGCGPGASAAAMARAGLRVTAVDAVAEMVALAARHPGVTALQQRFEDIDGTGIYGGIWANFSLLHADRAALPDILGALHRALVPKGRLHIAMKLGNGTQRDNLGRLYTYVTENELRGLLGGAGFTITEKAEGRDKGLDGTYADWIALAAYG